MALRFSVPNPVPMYTTASILSSFVQTLELIYI